MSELKYYCKFQEGYVNPSQTNRDYFNGPIKWLRASDLNDANVYETEKSLSIKGFKSAGKSAVLFPSESISISKSGTIGRLGILKDNMCGNRAVINIEVNSSLADTKYVFYLLKYKRKEIISKAEGSIQKNLYVSALERITLNHSCKSDQQKIAAVLSALDDKIELNNRINAELEQLAKTLYDYWFVQFEFPISKEQAAAMGKPELEGKPYKTSGGKLVWNEQLKREIPEGWGVKSLKEFADTGSGGTPLKTKKEYYNNGKIPWINSGELNSSFIISAEKYITVEGLKNSSAKLYKPGTILIAMYGATAGKVSIIDFEACTNQAVCAIIPKDEIHSIYLKISLEDLYSYLVNLSSGSARDNLSQDKIKELLFAIPDDTTVIDFNKTSKKSLSKILSNLKQNQHLSSLRDWLLPMLMNGQVRVE